MTTVQTAGFFGSLELDRKIVTALTDMGFEEPSPIQSQTIPMVLEGKDVKKVIVVPNKIVNIVAK